jgi:Bromodomain
VDRGVSTVIPDDACVSRNSSDYLCRRDAYGFFLEPVDLTIVTDYTSIIKEPMDLGN